ncbi:MAG: site-specific integrase [Muribaculaceae bacterium]|nr:site-specific integrase [Muribaculaceae bacterium]
MTSVKVKFRPSTLPDREGTIYYQIIHERMIRQLITDYHLFASEWDDRCVNFEKAQRPQRMDFLNSIRQRIHWDIELLNKIVRRLETQGRSFSSDTIIEEFHRCSREISLFNFMQGVIARLKCNGKTRTGETYWASLNSFRKFREGQDIRLDTITSGVMEGYQAWLQRNEIALNTISFYIRIIRAVYNRAVEEEMIENRHPFRRVYTGVEKTVKRALPLELIRKINGLDLTLKPKLQYARDMFILSFMLRGMSFIDMAFLKKRDLKDGHIVYRRRKTGQQLTIEWTKEMQEIVDRYPKNQTEYLLPIIRNGESQLRYAYKNIGATINKGLKKVAEIVGVEMNLSMYVARHSWASIAHAEGIPLSLISEGLGHEKESTTRIYLSTLDASAIDRANRHILGLI